MSGALFLFALHQDIALLPDAHFCADILFRCLCLPETFAVESDAGELQKCPLPTFSTNELTSSGS
jgi:hypothetical protein